MVPSGGDGEAGLGEAGGELGVGVDDGADGWEFAVEESVGVEVGGGFELAFDDLAVEVGDDHELGDEFVVVDAGGLDDDEALVAVDAAGVAEGVEDEAAADEFEVGFEDGGAEFFEEHGLEDTTALATHEPHKQQNSEDNANASGPDEPSAAAGVTEDEAAGEGGAEDEAGCEDQSISCCLAAGFHWIGLFHRGFPP